MIFVNCGGELDSYKNKKEVMDFFEDCIYCSEGSERERYTEIYFSVKENLNTKQRCFTDDTEYVYNVNFDINSISKEDIQIINKFYDIDLNQFKKKIEVEL